MQIIILGSAAAEAIPDPFCRCEVCEHARREGGREVRARAAALVNNDLLVDLGPDVVSAANRLNLYLGDVHTVLVTHRHEDHWLPSNLYWRDPDFAATPVAPLVVYGPGDALQELEPHLTRAVGLCVKAVKAADQWSAGPYRVTAVPATHGRGEIEALLYVIDDGQRRVFYGTDTSMLCESAWRILSTLGPLDLVLLDATFGLRSGGSGHQGLEQFLATRALMLRDGLITPHTTVVAHHFSHNGGLTHSALVDRFASYDVTVAYDGLTCVL
jgi:phosphoribosyl 1,2-cyclic phosphate phosphodiesterase